MKEPKERDVSAEVRAFMDSVKGCNANELVVILEGMIADVKENSYFAGIPEEEGAQTEDDDPACASNISLEEKWQEEGKIIPRALSNGEQS